VPIRGKPGARVELVVTFYAGNKNLPVVQFKQVARTRTCVSTSRRANGLRKDREQGILNPGKSSSLFRERQVRAAKSRTLSAQSSLDQYTISPTNAR
jgi:hypothetical protein